MDDPTRAWWRDTTVYHVYPRSFADGNGDGVGDLPGVIAHLDYLEDLGVETLWLSPFFRSPQADFGYDITDHTDVDPSHGSLADCIHLIDEVHRRGMKVVLDTVLNHTSIEHPWFTASRSGRDDPKRDWYIWRDGRRPGGRSRPNNWRNMLGARGWHHDAASDQWYWASFLPFQPDLNWRNPDVKAAMLGIVRHWLDLGVDGLRLDVFNAIFKDASFADNPRSLRPLPTESNAEGFFQRPLHTLDHRDTFALARELRGIVDTYDPPRFVVGEVIGASGVLREYVGATGEGLHLVFMFDTMGTRFSADGFRRLIADAESAFPAPLQPTWVFSNHDRPRAMLRLGDDPRKAKLLAMLQLTVRGVPFIYYGEELGLSHVEIPAALGQDPIAARFRWVPRWLARRLRGRGILLNRDECRLPMQWTAAKHAGFSGDDVTPWLPMDPRSATINVAVQHADPDSLLSTYRRLLRLRRAHPALHRGALELSTLPQSPAVLAYRRFDAGDEAHVVLNLGDAPVDVELPPGVHALHSTKGACVEVSAGRRRLAPYEGIVWLSTDEAQPAAAAAGTPPPR